MAASKQKCSLLVSTHAATSGLCAQSVALLQVVQFVLLGVPGTQVCVPASQSKPGPQVGSPSVVHATQVFEFVSQYGVV
jgi:hypothetical protein